MDIQKTKAQIESIIRAIKGVTEKEFCENKEILF